MAKKYIAFISYRHKPLDKSVAEKLHQAIEHYVIPKELRKDGNKRLGRVFRDQDELPVSGNLTQNIYEALDDSEYLIVICTPDTVKSEWVAREITYFIEHHDHDHILAVLAAGDPQESFPEQLTNICSDDGKVIQVIEPLAANIVADSETKRNRLFAKEKLRLFAGLLGCEFDELYKREQRYKTRLWVTFSTAVMLLLAGFIGVLLNRNAAIQSNYEQALRNQSSYLASESISSLQSADRFTAISLAIEALPFPENDRPLLSRAEYALGMAVNAYLTPYSSSGIAPYEVFVHNETVDDFTVNGDESCLITITPSDIMTCWDTASVSQKWSKHLHDPSTSSDFEMAGFNRNQELIVSNSKRIECLETEEGNPVWSHLLSDYESEITSISSLYISEDQNVLAAVTSLGILTIDPVNGNLLSSFRYPELPDELQYVTYPSVLSPEGTKLAMLVEKKDGLDNCGAVVIDLTGGSLSGYIDDFRCEELYATCGFATENKLLISYSDSSTSHSSNFGDQAIYYSQPYYLQCYDLELDRVLWENKRETNITNYGTKILYSESVYKTPVVVHSYCNHVDIIDAQTGESIKEAELLSSVINVELTRNHVFYFTRDGGFGLFGEDFSNWILRHSFEDGVKKAVYPDYGAWILNQSSNSIIHYTSQRHDPTWEGYTVDWKDGCSADEFYVDDAFMKDNIVAFIDGNHLLVGHGTGSGKLEHIILPGDSSDYKTRITYHFICSQDSILTLGWIGYEDYGFLNLNTDTQEYEMITWDKTDTGLHTVLTFNDNELYAVCFGDQGNQDYSITLCQTDTECNILKQTDIGVFHDPGSINVFGADSGDVFIVFPASGETYKADVKNGTAEKCPERIYELFAQSKEVDKLADEYVFSSENDLLAFRTALNELTITDHQGNEKFRVTGESAEVYSAYFTQDGKYLLTLEPDGCVRRYSLNDGSLLGSVSLSLIVYSSDEIKWEEFDDFLAVNVDHYMKLIRKEDWDIFAYVNSCYGYLEEQDRFICSSYDSSDIVFGSFPRHTVESLIEYGKSILKGWTLSEESRKQYGLD